MFSQLEQSFKGVPVHLGLGFGGWQAQRRTSSEKRADLLAAPPFFASSSLLSRLTPLAGCAVRPVSTLFGQLLVPLAWVSSLSAQFRLRSTARRHSAMRVPRSSADICGSKVLSISQACLMASVLSQ